MITDPWFYVVAVPAVLLFGISKGGFGGGLGVVAVPLMALVISGVWGSIILHGLLRRRERRLDSAGDDPRIEALSEEHRLLEARLEQLEEEVGFFRQLHAPDQERLGSGSDDAPEPDQ